MYDGFIQAFAIFRGEGAQQNVPSGRGKGPVYLCRPLGEDSRRLLGQQLIVPIDAYYHNTFFTGGGGPIPPHFSKFRYPQFFFFARKSNISYRGLLIQFQTP